MQHKILMIGDSVYPDTMGGSHRHIYDISTYLSKIKGYDITVYSPQKDKYTPLEETINGFTIKRYPKRKGRLASFFDFIINPYKMFKNEIKHGNIPQIIHGHWPLTVLLIFIYVRRHNLPIKLIYTFHGPIIEEYQIELRVNKFIKSIFLFIAKRMESTVLKLSDHISTASNYMRNKAISLYGNSDKIKTNYLAIDLEKFHPIIHIPTRIKEHINWDPSQKYIFTIRRLKKRMGIQLLIEAFRELIKKQDNFILLIAGKGDYQGELEKQVISLGLSQHIKFLGFLPDEDLSAYYSLSDVCIVPSLNLEGFGLTTIEAMSCGTPVVATNVCANTEILQGITPQFLCSLSPKDMATKIYEARNIKSQLSNKLRTYVESCYKIDNTIKGYLNLYFS